MAPRDFTRTLLLPMRVWDGPTRLFHWAILLNVAVSVFAAELGWMRLHRAAGLAALGLLLFRLAWGFVGSETARFRSFPAAPRELLRTLARFGERGPDTAVGHTAPGGWMAVALLALLAVQIASGLGNPGRTAAQQAFAGPLAHRLSPPLAQACAFVHDTAIWLLLAVIGLHVAVVLAYAVVKRQDLVRPMLTGRKRLPATTRQPRMASPLLAFVVAALAAAVTWLLALLA
jgi:cytochrome b